MPLLYESWPTVVYKNILAMDKWMKNEHFAHIITPHSRQWCLLLVMLKPLRQYWHVDTSSSCVHGTIFLSAAILIDTMTIINKIWLSILYKYMQTIYLYDLLHFPCQHRSITLLTKINIKTINGLCYAKGYSVYSYVSIAVNMFNNSIC